MVTLLMAFFLCVMSFSSFTASKRDGLERNSVVWRPRLRSASAVESSYREPAGETTERILQALESAAGAPSPDTFAIRLPLELLFENEERLSSSGARLLHALADNLRDRPWDLQFQVSHLEETPRAVQLCHFLMSQEGYEPARLAVGARSPREGEGAFVWLVLFHQS